MTDIKYHPLVDCDTDGMEKVPMFFSGDEAAVRKVQWRDKWTGGNCG